MIILVGVFVAELIVNYSVTGYVIETGATTGVFNYMIGPAPITFIQTGARFIPCMRPTALEGQALSLSDLGPTYPLEQACGMGGFPGGVPNQWFSHILPIFLHAGVIHILINLYVLYQTTAWLERIYGPVIISLLLLLSGVGGNVFGGSLSALTMLSVGASGAIFGMIAVELVELIRQWKNVMNPKRQLCYFMVSLAFMIALSFLAFVDYYAHIGGFIFGLFWGFALLPLLPGMSRRWLVARAASLLVAVALMVVLFVVFYTRSR